MDKDMKRKKQNSLIADGMHANKQNSKESSLRIITK